MYLSLTYQIAKDKEEPRPESSRLTRCRRKILDALAEAVGVPHQQGQTEIEIPEHLRGHRNISNGYEPSADNDNHHSLHNL